TLQCSIKRRRSLTIADCGLRIADLKKSYLSIPNPASAGNPQSAIRNWKIRNSNMPNLQDLRRRVRAVKNMRQITKAMKMVAAARLRRAQERVVAARPYTTKMMQILGDAIRRAPDYKDVLLVGHQREGDLAERLILVVVTADKGLCGAFNTN